MTTKLPLRETDLYQPVKDYLIQNGYTVRSEVVNCDITAIKDDDLIVIELKRSANIQLLIQATERQRITDSVYVAIPTPKTKGSRWRGIKRVLRMLEVGLMVVSFDSRKPKVKVMFDPLPYGRKKQKRRRRAVLREIAERSGDYNTAGSTGQKVITAYRENAIHIACCLDRFGPLSPKRLRALGTGDKTLGILANNYYGWFQRIDRGVYELTANGRNGLTDYPHLSERYHAIVTESEEEADAPEAKITGD
jgi:hypothetical protein|tara:strand:+ start:2098 stop:2847 length:750 start_codon:yes stop_codon:yes gene_type:complete